MMHTQSSEFAGKTVRIKFDHEQFNGKTIQIKDWWDKLNGLPWAISHSSVACLYYAVRTAGQGTLTDNEVLFGVLEGGYEHLIHVSEIGEVMP